MMRVELREALDALKDADTRLAKCREQFEGMAYKVQVAMARVESVLQEQDAIDAWEHDRKSQEACDVARRMEDEGYE
jgi:hypothetical protein